MTGITSTNLYQKKKKKISSINKLIFWEKKSVYIKH